MRLTLVEAPDRAISILLRRAIHKAQFRRADKLGARLSLALGETELHLDDLVAAVRTALGR